MAIIANQEQTEAVKAAADAYLDQMAELVAGIIPSGSPEGARQGTIGAVAVGVLLERMTHRFGALSAWSGGGQGIGMAFAQMPNGAEVHAAKIVLEEGIGEGYRNTLSAFATSSPLRS